MINVFNKISSACKKSKFPTKLLILSFFYWFVFVVDSYSWERPDIKSGCQPFQFLLFYWRPWWWQHFIWYIYYIIFTLFLLIHLFTHSWTSCNVMCVYWLTIIYLFVLSFVCPFVHSFIPLQNFEFHGPLFQSKTNYLLFTNSSTFCQRWHFLVFEKKCIRCFCFLYLHLLNK